MKVSVSTYSFSQYLNDGRLSQFDCISKAKEMGFDGIEFVDILPPDGVSMVDYAKELRTECERLGMTITNFTFAADFLNQNTQEEIVRVKGMVDLAQILGASSVRHDATVGYPVETRGYRGFDYVLPTLADACREVSEYAATLGIRTMVENHGLFCQESGRVERLIQAVGCENFGWLVDMGNFLCADENPAEAVGRAAPYCFYAHAKDFHIKSGDGIDPGEGFFQTRSGNYLRGAIIGHGEVPVVHCLRGLKQAGYDGFIAIEFEGMEDALTGISIGLSNLKRYIQEVYGE